MDLRTLNSGDGLRQSKSNVILQLKYLHHGMILCLCNVDRCMGCLVTAGACNTSGKSPAPARQTCGRCQKVAAICHTREGGSCGWWLPLSGSKCHGEKRGVRLENLALAWWISMSLGGQNW